MIGGLWVNPRHRHGPRDQVTALANRGTRRETMLSAASKSFTVFLIIFGLIIDLGSIIPLSLEYIRELGEVASSGEAASSAA